MADYVYLNVNPDNMTVSDCVTRAIHTTTGIPYSNVRKMLFPLFGIPLFFAKEPFKKKFVYIAIGKYQSAV